MGAMREGPAVRLNCAGCRFLRYQVDPTTVCAFKRVSQPATVCEHPAVSSRFVSQYGQKTWTPKWCPVLVDRIGIVAAIQAINIMCAPTKPKAPQFAGAANLVLDTPALSECEDALSNGVSIVSFNRQGEAQLVRPITSHSQVPKTVPPDAAWTKSSFPCRFCKSTDTYLRVVEDSEGHEDANYQCRACVKTWWVDGIDS